MKSTIATKFTLFFLILVVVSVSVSAQIDIQKYSVSYNFFSGAEVLEPKVCSCATYIDKISIANTGTFGAIFTVSTNIPDFAQVPINQVQLEPGQKVNLDVVIIAPCETERTLNYEVYVKSNFNREQVIKRNLIIQKCQTIEAFLFAEKESILPCEATNYTIKVNNPSTFTETYMIRPTDYSQYFSSQAYQLKLEPGQTGIVETTLGLDCSIYGKKQIGFKIESLNNKVEAKVIHELDVKQDYPFSATIPFDFNVCNDYSDSQKIILDNEARFSNTFKISLIGAPEFMSLSTNYLELDGNEKGEFEIITKAGTYDLGIYNFSIKIETGIGDNVIEKVIYAYVNDCSKLSVSILSEQNLEICSGDYDYEIEVSNEGSKTENVYLEVYGSEYASVIGKKLVVKPGEKEYTTLRLNVPEWINNEKLYLTVVGALWDTELKEEWLDQITVTAVGQYQCYEAISSKKRLYIRYSDDTAYINIQNKGVKEGAYEVKITPDSLFLESDRFILSPEEKVTLTLKKDFNGSEPRNVDYVLSIKSLENWYDYNYTLRVTQTNTPLTEKAWNYFSQSTCKIFTLILLLLLIAAAVLFIVRISIKGRTWKDQTMFRIILLIIAIIFVVVVFAVFGEPVSYKPVIEESDPLTISWHEDTTKKINLYDYFSDPDNDVLIFGVSGEHPDNISIEIKDGVAKFVPDKDWSGNRRIRFYAEDADGERVTSSRMTLEVVEVPDYAWYDLHAIYCAYFNLIIILIIIFLLMITPFKNRKYEDKGKVAVTGIKKEKGYVYFVDKDGDISKREAPQRKSKKNGKKNKR